VKWLQAMALWAPVIACAVVIHIASVRTVPPVPAPPIPHLDKLLHAGAYGLLTLLLAHALRGSTRAGLGDVAVAACLWATAYGGMEEIIQRWFPDRSSDIADVLANGVGAAMAAMGWHWAMVRLGHRRQSGTASHD